MIRATAKYSSLDRNEIVFELPIHTSIIDSIQQAKQLSNEYLTAVYENNQDPEPSKMKKNAEDSEDSLE